VLGVGSFTCDNTIKCAKLCRRYEQRIRDNTRELIKYLTDEPDYVVVNTFLL